jgi:methylmalonyl-CoA mutase cobalamin-binding subunit
LHRSVELNAALRQALMKQGLQRFVSDTVAPLAAAVGEAWMRGEVEVPEEHLFTEQVQNVLRSAIAAHATPGGRPRVLLTTFPEEEHVLGLLMAEAMLVPEGVACLSLGTRTPLADIRSAAVGGEFDIVGLSFSIAYPARQAIDGLLELRAMLPDEIAIWAGGAAVRDKHKRLPGIRVVGGLDDTLAALRDWRAEHP